MRNPNVKDTCGNVSDSSDSGEPSDCDTGDKEYIERTFVAKCSPIAEKEVALDQKYILHIAGTLESTPNIAVSSSESEIDIFNLSNNQFAHVTSLSGHLRSVVDVKFNVENNNLVYTGSSDGNIKLWDLRTFKPVCEFTDTSSEHTMKRKLFTCFDVCFNNRLLCAGTELFESEAFILFWDIRNVKLMGGYWESHMYDITEVRFHPNDANRLASGSTDGLINIYDLSQAMEDDALTESLNTESSVEQLLWFENGGGHAISCVTHMADVQLWTIDGAGPYAHFRRADIAQNIQRKSESHCYVTSVLVYSDNQLLLLAGSNWRKGECMRGLSINRDSLSPLYNFSENKQNVRSSWYNKNINFLLTGGERGILNAWRLDDDYK